MAKFNINLLEDIDRLFKEKSLDDVVGIEKLLDGEIEHKRVDLRSMVGDRYKDVLTASDAIKSMKSLSETIVNNIQKITDRSEHLIKESSTEITSNSLTVEQKKTEDRTIVVQIRLALCVNEQIWNFIDCENYSKAAQLYLLAQHIHTGLRLQKDDMLDRIPILRRIKSSVEYLRSLILERIKEKLQTVEISAQDTSSNLTALMLLENETSLDLLRFFMNIRKNALLSVKEKPHPSVRAQVASMVRCLITTVHLLHDCFLNVGDNKEGLIWQELDTIVGENAPKTIDSVQLPDTTLVQYISNIIKQFRPKCTNVKSKLSNEDIENVIKEWLDNTSKIVRDGLNKSLELVTNIKGLHIIREEALKTDIPDDWAKMCSKANLPSSFDIWYYFFQDLISDRAKYLITKKCASIVNNLETDILDCISSSLRTDISENNFRLYIWTEDVSDVSRSKNEHLGLSMKTKGFSPSIANLCEKMDKKYLEFLQDVSFYLYGKEFEHNTMYFSIRNTKVDKKFCDRDKLENHLMLECKKNTENLTQFLSNIVKEEMNQEKMVLKSLLCARFLQALTSLCPHYHQCCTSNRSNEEWEKICSTYNKFSLQFWTNWVDDSAQKTKAASQSICNIDAIQMITVLPKWDTIEIQEQTEERVFKSQIKVPCQCSLVLQEILSSMNNNINSILPQTMPKQVHLEFIQKNVLIIFNNYEVLSIKDINQTQALQFLFDVKLITFMTIPRENIKLMQKSQEICDKLRSKVDPFDLDVFYSYLQHNVKQSVLQLQVILRCLLPSTNQLSSLGVIEKNKDHDKEPSILALSIPSSTSWFPLLPVTAPVQKTVTTPIQTKDNKVTTPQSSKSTMKKSRSSAASLFGAMTTDWFS